MNRKLVFVLTALACGAFAADKPRGFSGMWVLDPHSPRPGGAPNQVETKIRLEGSMMTLESKYSRPPNGIVPMLYLGVMATKLCLNVNGGEQENLVGPFDIQSKTRMDGLQMLTDFVATMFGDEIRGQWIYTLSNDAKHLIIEIKEKTGEGSLAHGTLYFVRK